MRPLVSVLCGLAASAGVLTTVGHHRASAQEADAGVALVLTDQAFTVGPDQPWHAVFDVIGQLADVVPPTTTTTTTTVPSTVAGDAPAPSAVPDAPAIGVTADVRVVARRPIATRADLAAVIDGQRLPVLDTLSVPLSTALTTASGTTTLTVDAPTSVDTGGVDALALARPGLYPITVQVLVDGDVVAEHHTFVERLPGDAPDAAPMRVAIVATTPDPGPLPTPDELAEGRRQVAAIATTAAAVDGPITVAIPPVLLTGLTADEPSLAATVRASFDGDELLAMPADVLDPSSAVTVDEGAAFTRELVEGEAVLDQSLAVTSTRESAWLTPIDISTGAASMLRNLAFRSLVFSPEIYSGLDGNIGGFVDTTLTIGVDLGDGGAFPAMVVNPASSLLDAATLEGADLSPTDAAVHLVAQLVTARRELGDDRRRSAVLLPSGGVVPDAEVAGQVATFVNGLPDFALAPLSELPGATDTMIVGPNGPHLVTLPETAGPDLRERNERIELTRVAAASSGSMLVDNSRLTAWSSELDMLLSTGLDDAEVDARLVRISNEGAAVRKHVVVPRPFTFTLTGRSSPLRLNFISTASEPMQVLVSPSSPKLTFPEGPKLVVLGPDGVTEVVLEVEARSNGTSSLEVSILTPAFNQEVTEPVVLTARVNALTGLGQVVTGAAVLVLVSWWYGHFRGRRRRRLMIGGLDGPPALPVALVSPDAAEAAIQPPAEGAGDDSVSHP